MGSVFGTNVMRTAQPFQQSFAGLSPCPPAPLERSVVALGRKTLIGAGAALCFLTAWASGATWYLISHDEIVARFLARQTEMQYAYEDRIAALRTHLDRVAKQVCRGWPTDVGPDPVFRSALRLGSWRANPLVRPTENKGLR